MLIFATSIVVTRYGYVINHELGLKKDNFLGYIILLCSVSLPITILVVLDDNSDNKKP